MPSRLGRVMMYLCASCCFLIFCPESHGETAVPSEASLPSAPEPAAQQEPWNVPPAGTSHQESFSRVGIGANVSPLGIGINATTVLTDYFDVRLMGNFFGYTVNKFDIEGVAGTGNLHFASMAASLDWYPYNSVFRLSPGMMFYNGNQISFKATLAPGNSVTFNGQDFYSASPNPATGATPLAGNGILGLHRHRTAFTLAGGFGKFVPRSNRHWSFPAEFGAIFMGAPTVDVTTSGWVCLDGEQTQCSNISDATNPIAREYNTALQAQLTKWRHSLSNVTVYPMFSYSVVYSFNIR